MTYRFVKVTSYYRAFLSAYYTDNPTISSRPYADQLAHLMAQGFGWSDSYSRHLRALGVDAHEIVANAKLQKAWALEHNRIPIASEAPFASVDKTLVLQQLQELKPDVVFFQDSLTFNGEWIRQLKRQVPSIRLVLGYLCSRHTESLLREFHAFDLMISCTPCFVNTFRASGLPSELIYHGFDVDQHSESSAAAQERPFNLTFTGSLFAGNLQHGERLAVIEALIASGVDVRLLGNVAYSPRLRLLARQALFVAGKLARTNVLASRALSTTRIGSKALNMESFPAEKRPSRKLMRAVRPAVYGRAMFDELGKAKIALNVHIDASGSCAGNVRLFEATGMGACLVTDWKDNLPDLFTSDEVVSYRSTAECIEKIQWLVEHPAERAAIAEAGRRRTLLSHRMDQRAGELDELIRRRI